MNPPDQSRLPPIDDDEVGALAAACLERFAHEGEAVVREVCADRVHLVPEVCGILDELMAAGMLEPAATAGPGGIRAVSGDQIGEFVLRRKLGVGGMGMVWLADQPRLGRVVALKLVRPDLLLSRKSKERFEREVTAISKIDHPHICTVYEAGEIQGQPYLAMRYVEGGPLSARLTGLRQDLGKSSNLSGSEQVMAAVHLVEKLARALQTVHDAGFIHRDVKPGNILLEAEDEPVLVDFGLARRTDAEARLTRTGDPVGTPVYMAPEQIQGRSEEVGPATDVYALGVVLYQCLVLRPPFEGPDRECLYQRILNEPPPDPRTQNPAIPADLVAILEKALHKHAAQRFASALDLAEELARLRRHEPTRTRPPGFLGRAWRWCRRNATAAISLLAVSVCLLLSLLLLAVTLDGERRARVAGLISASAQQVRSNPESAFKLAWAAVDADPANPLALGALQVAAQTLRRNTVLDTDPEATDLGSTIRFSPDGRYFVVGGQNWRTSLHSAVDGQRIGDFLGPPVKRRVTPVAWGPNGQLIHASRLGQVDRFQVKDGQLKQLEPLRTSERIKFLSVAVGPLGEVLAGAKQAVLWSPDGKPQVLDARPPLGQRRMWAVAFLPDGRCVAAGRLWERRGRQYEPVTELSQDFASKHAKLFVLVAPAQQRIIVGALSAGFRIFDFEGRSVQLPQGSLLSPSLSMLSLSSDGGRLLASHTDGRVVIRDSSDGRVLSQLPIDEQDRFRRVAVFSADDRRIVVGDWQHQVRVFGLRGAVLRRLHGHRGGVYGIAVRPGTGHLDVVVSVSADGTARLWGAAAEAGVRRKEGLIRPTLAGVPGSGEVLVASGDGRVMLLSPTGKIARQRHLDGLEAPAICLAPDGQRAVVSSFDGRVWIWEFRTNEMPEVIRTGAEKLRRAIPLAGRSLLLQSMAKIQFHTTPAARTDWPQAARADRMPVAKAEAVAVSGDGERVAWAWSGVLRVFRRGQQGPPRKHESPASRDPVRAMAWIPGGGRLVLGRRSGELEILDTASGTWRALTAHTRGIADLCVSGDGQRLASSTEAGRVWVRRLADEHRLIEMEPVGDTRLFLCFSGADQLITADRQGILRWFGLEPQQVREQLRAQPLSTAGWTETELRTWPDLLR